MTEWLLTQSSTVVYCGIFLLLLSGALGFPPEDISLMIGGIAVHHNKGDPLIVFAICYFGTIVGDLFIYMVGRRYGPALFTKPWVKSRVAPSRIRWVKRGLEKRSLPTIFIARHLFYLRTLTFLTCGAVRMRFFKFLAADAFSALVSVPLMLVLGYIASDNYQTVIEYMKRAKLISLVLILLGTAAIAWIYFRNKMEREARDEEKDSHQDPS